MKRFENVTLSVDEKYGVIRIKLDKKKNNPVFLENEYIVAEEETKCKFKMLGVCTNKWAVKEKRAGSKTRAKCIYNKDECPLLEEEQ